MTEEIFDVVNDRDEVIGQAPRSVVHAENLLHRAVHVFVFDSAGKLLLQRRSAQKDQYPRCYTSSASGHLGAGETYAAAAPRELEEELGLNSPLEWLAKFPASQETAWEQTVLFRTTPDTVPRCDPEEIESAAFHSLDEIAAMIAAHPEEHSPPFRVLFAWYRAHAV
jgi:16S rRNA (adenine1518-N6/adenine1519-N6)-dimethyltransferase